LAVPLAVIVLGVLAPGASATTTTVTNCSNDSQFSTALVGGGTITFNCGTATIILSSTKTISASTTINGGGKITLSGNSARRLFVVNAGASLQLADITLTKGASGAGNGGAVENSGFLALDRVIVTNSTSGAAGGAVMTYGRSNITDSTIAGSKALNGGAVAASGASANVSISRTVLRDSMATGTSDPNGRGGALFVGMGAQVYVYASDIYNNSARQGGGVAATDAGTYLGLLATTRVRLNHASEKGSGLFNSTKADVDMVTLASNSGTGNSLGGGIYNYGNLTVTNSTVRGNSAYYGAGISNAFATVALTNVTISGNIASAYGGGLDNIAGTATLTNVTFSANQAGSSGGGIFNEGIANTKLNLKNVLLANNTVNNCFFQLAPITSVTNMSTDATCSFGSGRDSVAVLLGPLETNGWFTATHRLLPGSAAINTGTNGGAPTIDQRNVSRPQGGVVDIGAVEYVPCTGTPTTKPTLVSPALNASLTATQPILDWAGPDCATKFKVVVRRGSTTGTTVFSKTNVFPQSQVQTTALTRARTYFWRVTGCNAAGCLAGDWWSFKIL
jgi:hypothetical protein